MAGNMQHFFVRSENYQNMTQRYEVSKVKSLSRVRLFGTPWTGVLPDSSVHGIFQAIVLEWIAISFSRASSWPRDQTQVSRIVGRRFTVWATRELSKGY